MRRQGSGMKYSKLLVIVIGAIGLWVSSRFTWLTVHTFDDKAGDAVTALSVQRGLQNLLPSD